MSKFTKLCDEFEQVLMMDSEFRQRWLRLRETGEGIIKEQGFTIFQMEKDWREKAEKFDKLQDRVEYLEGLTTGDVKMLTANLVKIQELEQKLKAIREIVSEVCSSLNCTDTPDCFWWNKPSEDCLIIKIKGVLDDE